MRAMRLISLCLFLLLLAPSLAWAGEIASHMQRQYESLSSFSAQFEQTLLNAQSGERRLRKGTITFKQPQFIRWETVSPDPELLLVGDKVVWDYFSDEKTAYKYASSDILSSKTMLRFISGKAKLEEDFYVTEEGLQDGLHVLGLIPKEPEPGLVEARLWITPDHYMLAKVLLVDFYGNKNQLALNDLVLNLDPPGSTFEFNPPKGVKLFEGGAKK
jgi:outer membrane lipoprotein carrier protein